MTPGGAQGHAIRRVLVALDPMAQCQAALETAARLAARSEAELVGVFVEEGAFLEAAALPVTGLVSGHDYRGGRVDAATMARGLRVWAARAEASLTTVAERWRVKATFRVARGQVTEVLSAEAGGSDLIALGTVARPSGALRIGETARVMTRRGVCPVLVMRGPGQAVGPVLVVYGGSARALALGAELARNLDVALALLTVDEAQRAEAEGWARRAGVETAVERIGDGTPADVVAEIDRRGAGLVVLDRTGAPGAEIEAERILAGTAGAVVVVAG